VRLFAWPYNRKLPWVTCAWGYKAHARI